MIRRLRTGAWSMLSFGFRESLTQLERVESLRVKDERSAVTDKNDISVEDGSSSIFNVDYFQDARRQVYSESLIFRTTPFYASRVRLEQRSDEHHLLRMHLAYLERSERNGPLLMPDEYSFLDPNDPITFSADTTQVTSLPSHSHAAPYTTTHTGGISTGLEYHPYQPHIQPQHRVAPWIGSRADYTPRPSAGAAGTLNAANPLHQLQQLTGDAAGSRMQQPLWTTAVNAVGVDEGPFAPAEGMGSTTSNVAAAAPAEPAGQTARGTSHFWGVGAQQPVVCTMGQEPHLLNWDDWIKRQRRRGWFTSETLYYMTVFGAVVGAGDFTTFWSQMQIWRSSMFFIPYLAGVFIVGIPCVQTEILAGNLFRGAPVKGFTQLSPWLLGAGLLTFISCFFRVVLLANRSGLLLIYFVASVSTPHPWQVTAEDLRTCYNYSGQPAQCEAAMHGTLCHYIEDDNICMASPTGKATYYYLSELQPYTLDNSLNPDRLQGKMVGAITFVWLYILAYIWRGLFKLGFLSAVLMFVAVVLCVTLIFVSFFSGNFDGAREVTKVIVATFNFRQMLNSLGDSRLSAAIVDFVLSDMTLGCGVYATVSSFTKIGYNVSPSAWYTSVLNFAMSTVAFAALLAVVGNIQASTGVSVANIVSKTGGAASYFVIFPAAFEKVSAPNVFAMFFYGGIFVLNTQVAAISIHCMINILMEARGFRTKHRKWASVGLVFCCFIFSIPLCCANQTVRVRYLAHLVCSFLIPVSVLLQSIAFGWFHNISLQIRLAGRRSVVLHLVLCAIFALMYCLLAGYITDSFIIPLFCPLVWNALTALVIAAVIKEPRASTRFAARFWALFIGNIEGFRHQICRQTLFRTSNPMPLIWCFKAVPRIICHCMRHKPFFLCRPSLFWSVCVKHIVPVATMLPVIHGIIEMSTHWEAMAPSPNLRAVGVAIIVISYAISLGVAFIPKKISLWIVPPPEDYMPIKYFPHHPYVPPYCPPVLTIVRSLLKEFLSSSTHASRYLGGVLAQYRLHYVQRTNTWVPGPEFDMLGLPSTSSMNTGECFIPRQRLQQQHRQQQHSLPRVGSSFTAVERLRQQLSITGGGEHQRKQQDRTNVSTGGEEPFLHPSKAWTFHRRKNSKHFFEIWKRGRNDSSRDAKEDTVLAQRKKGRHHSLRARLLDKLSLWFR